MTSPTSLPLDLTRTPFSRRGSWFALSDVPDPAAPGLHLRTVRGGVEHREILRLLVDGDASPRVQAEPGRLSLHAGSAHLEVALDGPGRALLRVSGGPVTLEFCASRQYDAVLPTGPSTWRFIDSGANRNYQIQALHGSADFDSQWDGIRNLDARLTLTPDAEPALVVIDEFSSAVPTEDRPDFDLAAAEATLDYDGWHHRHNPTHTEGLQEAVRLAAYVTWSALVPAGGLLRRESMLMSKNTMTHVWSWDHCFNAAALWRDPTAAAAQLWTIFDHQDQHGGLPDYVNDAIAEWNFVKPPVHGWAIGYLMDRDGLTDLTLAELYEPLARWTDWWPAHRVYGSDGVPSYNHGNDSGWDNSTVFGAGVPVQSPDLLAFLALQMHTLARLAERVGRPADAYRWTTRASDTTALLLEQFWQGDRFVARDTLTQQPIESASLLTLMPLALGDHLPPAVFEACVDRLVTDGYLTAHGPATEPPASAAYVADGYWRGPIWAPTTMLLVDGLRRGGRPDLADQITESFLRTCADEGMAENFDALTGEGLRDRSMTWTASVFLAMTADLGAPAPRPHRAPREDALR